MIELTQERLKELLHYDPETGVFTWLCPPKNVGRISAGDVMGTSTDAGYMVGGVAGKRRYLHRLAFFYMTGEWPPNQVDHVDLDKSNNSWNNLRLATQSQNQGNRLARNALGIKGVKSKRGKFEANIRISGNLKYLGTFRSAEEAHAAYTTAANDHFGEFARTA